MVEIHKIYRIGTNVQIIIKSMSISKISIHLNIQYVIETYERKKPLIDLKSDWINCFIWLNPLYLLDHSIYTHVYHKSWVRSLSRNGRLSRNKEWSWKMYFQKSRVNK